MIQLVNITKKYKTKHQTVEALKDISLTFPNNGMFFITGKSGSGKTTLLNILGGLDTFDAGDFLLFGNSVKKYSESDWEKYRNSFVGYVFQENNLFENDTVYDNIELALDIQGFKNKKERIAEALQVVGLEEYNKRKITELSGGQKQRIAIARAIAKDSVVILADEPTGSLDQATGKEIFELLKTISKTKLVIVVSHDVESAQKYGDSIIEISDGRLSNTQAELDTPEKDREKIDLKHGKFSIGRKIKMAGRSFIAKPIRFIILLLLCSFGFSLMAGALKFANWEPYTVQNELLKSEGIAYISRTEIESESSGSLGMKQRRTFKQTDVENFAKTFPSLDLIMLQSNSDSIICPRFTGELTERQQTYYNLSTYPVVSTDKTQLDKLGFVLLAGELPSDNWSKTDIAVSKFLFEVYELIGFQVTEYSGDPSVGWVQKDYEIKDYNDIIGKTIDGYTIKGVIDTNYDRERFDGIKAFALGKLSSYPADYTTEQEYYQYVREGFHNAIFVKPGVVVSNLDMDQIAVIYNEQSFEKDDFIKKVLDGSDYYFTDYYSTLILNNAQNANRFGNIMFYIALVTVLFAIVLFSNFISVSIIDKSKEIGILCALGTGKKTILSVFLTQNIFTGVIVFLCSYPLIQYAIIPILMALGSPEGFPANWYSIYVSDYLIILLLIVASAVVASVLPFLSFYRRSPRKIIYGK